MQLPREYECMTAVGQTFRVEVGVDCTHLVGIVDVPALAAAEYDSFLRSVLYMHPAVHWTPQRIAYVIDFLEWDAQLFGSPHVQRIADLRVGEGRKQSARALSPFDIEMSFQIY